MNMIELRSVNCARGISVILSGDHTVILIRDGRVDNIPQCGMIYPFSKNVEKKEPLFGKRVCQDVKIVCLATNSVHTIPWGTMGGVVRDTKSGKSYRLGASGRLYFSIDDSNKFFRKLVGMFRGKNQNEQLKDYLRDMVVNAFPGFWLQADVSPAGVAQLPLEDILGLSSRFCDQLQQQIAEFGLRVCPQSKSGLLAHMVSEELGA